MTIIETRKLTRKFGTFTAVDSLDMAIESGESFALLGPNGAVEAYIDGFNIIKYPNKARKIIGYVPQMIFVDGTLTGIVNLLLFAKLYDIPEKDYKSKALKALEFMGLSDAGKKPVHQYSGGMIRRLKIAQSMMHKLRVLFLDEPTVGLDPIAYKTVWDHIAKLRKEYNTTIPMTTYVMDEADSLCNRIAFMSRGKLVALGTPQELKNYIRKPGILYKRVII